MLGGGTSVFGLLAPEAANFDKTHAFVVVGATQETSKLEIVLSKRCENGVEGAVSSS